MHPLGFELRLSGQGASAQPCHLRLHALGTSLHARTPRSRHRLSTLWGAAVMKQWAGMIPKA